MNTLMMAAAGRRLVDWRRHVKIDLDIQSNRVINKVTGEQAIIPAGMTYSTLNGKNVAVFNSSVIGGIQLAHDPAFAPGEEDYTLELIIDVDDIYTEPADNSQIIPFCNWGAWHAPGQTVQFDATYRHLNGGELRIGNYNSGPSFVVAGNIGLINLDRINHYVFQRKRGTIQIFINGEIVYTGTDSRNYTATINSPFRIMSRRGGNTGNVWWRFIGKLIGFRFTHAAVYNGPFISPDSF